MKHVFSVDFPPGAVTRVFLKVENQPSNDPGNIFVQLGMAF
jgi:hypothetical protein